MDSFWEGTEFQRMGRREPGDDRGRDTRQKGQLAQGCGLLKNKSSALPLFCATEAGLEGRRQGKNELGERKRKTKKAEAKYRGRQTRGFGM